MLQFSCVKICLGKSSCLFVSFRASKRSKKNRHNYVLMVLHCKSLKIMNELKAHAHVQINLKPCMHFPYELYRKLSRLVVLQITIDVFIFTLN